MVDVHLPPGLGEHLVGEVGDGDPKVTVPEVEPEGEAGLLLSETMTGGRPACAAPAGWPSRSPASPPSSRSATMVEIVERERP